MDHLWEFELPYGDGIDRLEAIREAINMPPMREEFVSCNKYNEGDNCLIYVRIKKGRWKGHVRRLNIHRELELAQKDIVENERMLLSAEDENLRATVTELLLNDYRVREYLAQIIKSWEAGIDVRRFFTISEQNYSEKKYIIRGKKVQRLRDQGEALNSACVKVSNEEKVDESTVKNQYYHFTKFLRRKKLTKIQ